ncbi:uncharacterized protein LOC121771414 [Salvia splendens]|uniref:uncharacterized protein LOC121771414 n=1 Tax=Salvia splendens TaxID=180675 RepID=UPI001C27514D|nr:uncharacterized protein LOC121771414 [Salvia splendens]
MTSKLPVNVHAVDPAGKDKVVESTTKDKHANDEMQLHQIREKQYKILLSVPRISMNAATTRVKKASYALRSPHNEREVRITAKANQQDKELFYWMIDMIDTDPATSLTQNIHYFV